MAVTFTFGTVGSGKTYCMVKEAVDDLQDGRFVPTINLHLKPENIVRVLLSRGMSVYDANRAAGRTEPIWTAERFRQLRDARLKVDEAHFWWPQNQYRKIDMEDILTAAMSRKRRVDIHIISQLSGSVNQNVRDLALDVWQARALLVEPFYSGLKILSRLARAMKVPALDRPAAFYYERVVDGMGVTSKRKDGTARPEDKRLVFLNPMIARCYDTLQEVSSPVLDEMRDRSRIEYLQAVAKGDTRPRVACPVCNGTRSWKFLTVPVELPDGTVTVQRIPYDPEELRRNVYAKPGEGDCEHCDDGTGPRGYLYTDDHPDYEEAERIMAQVAARMRRAAQRGAA